LGVTKNIRGVNRKTQKLIIKKW